MTHFWKLLAGASLVAAGWGYFGKWDQDVSDRKVTGESAATETRSLEDGPTREQPQRLRLMRDLIDKQSQPASIVFKNQAPGVLGYLAAVDDDYVVLRSFYKDEAKEQTVLIPWENILYIRLNTKVPTAAYEMTASHDTQFKSAPRARR